MLSGEDEGIANGEERIAKGGTGSAERRVRSESRGDAEGAEVREMSGLGKDKDLSPFTGLGSLGWGRPPRAHEDFSRSIYATLLLMFHRAW